ncbi:hypothetical protein FIBSPDRAFT_144082 [Athelia psychrophila]|uniref:Uncharacterized protein n=1 Tax=Athelia psychrophila TaxID=1759441 RepID=A0A166T2D6_9AGAM|nr:hypothetical protein FIBSPDRAFT_144082 [Fibularhizoctonia sp. CBS 109695]
MLIAMFRPSLRTRAAASQATRTACSSFAYPPSSLPFSPPSPPRAPPPSAGLLWAWARPWASSGPIAMERDTEPKGCAGGGDADGLDPTAVDANCATSIKI